MFERFERAAVVGGLRIEDVVFGLPLTLEQLRDPSEWMDWEVHAEICDRLERAGGPESSVRAGHEIWKLRYGASLRRIASLAIDLKHLYRIGLQWRLPKVHRNIGVRIVNLEPRQLRVELTIPSHLRGSAAWLRIMQGALEAAPTTRGLPRAIVDADITPHRGVFRVTLPKQPLHPLALVRVFMGDPALTELNRQIEELRVLELERLRIDETLRNRERTLSNLIANLSGMVYRCRCDERWSLEFVSEGCFALCGRRSDELVGDDGSGLAALIHPDDLRTLYDRRRAALDARSACSDEYRLRTRTGEVRWVLDVARGIYDDTGRLEACEGFITDVTARKHNDEAKARLEEDLAHSRRLESVGRLAGGIAHDFNNWLTVIFANVEIVAQKLELADPLRAHIEQIDSAAARAASLTQQVLAFARKQPIQPRVVSLNDLVATLEKLLQRVLDGSIELTTLCARDLWLVELDPGQFEQVLMNLAINARDAMPDGGRLIIETRNVTVDGSESTSVKPGSYVRLSVTDTGTGMTDDVRARVFEPFFTTKAVGKGTGLGLASAHGLVRQANGEILVFTTLGEGTSFHIYLPRISAG